MQDDEILSKNLILFDGVCNFCNFWVNFVIARDSKNKFVFASLQSSLGQRMLAKFGRQNQSLDSVLLIKNNQIKDRSTAALKIASELDFPWSLAKILFLFPQFFRDFIYGLIAKNRYVFFGKKEYCRLPTLEEKNKILE